jgi:hypothetical protein
LAVSGLVAAVGNALARDEFANHARAPRACPWPFERVAAFAKHAARLELARGA